MLTHCIHVQGQLAAMTGLQGLQVFLLFLKAVVLLDRIFHKAQALEFTLEAYLMLSQRPWLESTLLTGAR